MKSSVLLKRILDQDQKVIRFLARNRKPIIVKILNMITETGRLSYWTVFLVLLFIANYTQILVFEKQQLFFNCSYGALLGWIFASIVKRIFKRPRPIQTLDNFTADTHSPINESFPSSHSSAAMGFFFCLCLAGHPLLFYVGLWAVTVCFSRIYLGVHYLTDVIAGIALGFFGAWLAFNFII